MQRRRADRLAQRLRQPERQPRALRRGLRRRRARERLRVEHREERLHPAQPRLPQAGPRRQPGPHPRRRLRVPRGLDDARGWRAITGPAVAELPGDAAPGPTARPTKPPAQPVEDEEEEDDDEAADVNVPKDRSRKPGSKARSKVAVATMAPDSSVTGRRPAGPLLAAAVLRATWLDAAGPAGH